MRSKFIFIFILLLSVSIAYSFPTLNIDSWKWIKGRAGVSQIIENDSDMFVLNPTFYRVDEIEEIKDSDKIVLAYVLAGEADRTKDYWGSISIQPWIVGTSAYNPNHVIIKFWNDSGIWRSKLKDYISDLIERGYDGVFIDPGHFLKNFNQHKKDYAILVDELVEDIHTDFGDKYIVLLNSSEIIEYDDLPDMVDGLAEEGIWWNENHHSTREDIAYEKTEDLKMAQGYGITTMCVEYPDLPADIMSVEINAESNGFIPCILPE
jgi:uncharacterized protein (TIGR01370 family)